MRVLTRIRVALIKDFVKATIAVVFSMSMNLFIGYLFFETFKPDSSFENVVVVLIILMGIFLINTLVKVAFRDLFLIIFPKKTSVYKFYGDEIQIENILEEIENSKIFEYKNFVISGKYICDKKDLCQLIKCEDIIKIVIATHKSKGSETGYMVKLISKNKYICGYKFNGFQKENANAFAEVISKQTGLPINNSNL